MVVVLGALLACGEGDKDNKSAPTPAPSTPLAVRFGDCAAPTYAWVSGPKPLPFTSDEVAGIVAANDDPPPPPDDPPPLRPAPDARTARQQAIEQAGTAGILGSTALTNGGAFVPDGFDDTDIYGGLLASEERAVSGLGTITGVRYGTSGTGYAPSGKRSNVPTTSLGSPNAQGDLDKALIRRFVKRNIQKIKYCYERELLAKPGLGGTVQTQFFISPDGTVASASATGVDPTVADCIARVIRAIEFPAPKGGGGVQVNYPFTLRPADASSPPPSAAPAVANAPTASTPPRTLFRPLAMPPVDATSYRPGIGNPLRGEEGAIGACAGKLATRHGVAVVELGYDADGAVTAATVHGIDDAGVRDCVAAAAKRVKRATARVTSERCSLAFGELADSALPAIEVTADAIAYAGRSYRLADGERTSLALVTVLAAELAPILADKGPVVSVRDPRVVRPMAEAKMRDVNAAIASAIRAMDDVVLAHTDGTLFVPLALPTVPVPFGTGGRWFPIKTRASITGTLPRDDDRVHLSLLVEKERVWIGLSRVNEFQEIPAAEVATQLLQPLRDHKASALFANRVDIEIAGDADASYAQLVQVIDLAEQAGFTDWRFAMPEDLSARPQL
jgi:hypothetical protein